MGIPKHSKVKDDVAYWKILLYADSGSGKTVFALRGMRVLVLSIGSEIEGLMSAARIGTDAEKIEARKWEDISAVNVDLWSDEGQAWLRENFDVLVVDGLTEADSQCMQAILRDTRATKLAKDTDPDKPWIDDYGTRNIYMEKLVRSINDLPINVLWTALARVAEEKSTGKEFMVPMMGGNKATDYRFPMKLAALMTSFGYMRTEVINEPAPTTEKPDAVRKVKQRVVYWEDNDFAKAKDRTTVLAPTTVNFTMKHMQLLIQGRIGKDANGKAVRLPTPGTPPAPTSTPTPTTDQPAKSEPDQTSPVAEKEVSSEQNPPNLTVVESGGDGQAVDAKDEAPQQDNKEKADVDLVGVEP